VLGIGRQAVRAIGCDSQGRMRVDALRSDRSGPATGILPMAIVANAGTTNTETIDPLRPSATLPGKTASGCTWTGGCRAYWTLHPPPYDGLELADSVIVGPLVRGASVGVAAVRAAGSCCTSVHAEPADYLEGAIAQASGSTARFEHSLDDFGEPITTTA
jgi:hypothetical protein